jgi:glycosyltransferase involved in cell wall biosynthesis
MPKFSAIITATSTIKDKFAKINTKSFDINNYPILNELKTNKNWDKKNEICYIGGISEARGIKQNIDALAILGHTHLNLAGNYIPESLKQDITKLNGWKYVNEFGFVDRKQVKKILSDSFIGLVTLLPTPNHLESLPIKMFEYMSASIPVIASNFPLWEKIVNENQCGICVDPEKPDEIAKAIKYLFENPEKAKEMGENGRLAVENKFNWQNEEKKLFTIYSELEEIKHA